MEGYFERIDTAVASIEQATKRCLNYIYGTEKVRAHLWGIEMVKMVDNPAKAGAPIRELWAIPQDSPRGTYAFVDNNFDLKIQDSPYAFSLSYLDNQLVFPADPLWVDASRTWAPYQEDGQGSLNDCTRKCLGLWPYHFRNSYWDTDLDDWEEGYYYLAVYVETPSGGSEVRLYGKQEPESMSCDWKPSQKYISAAIG